ARRGSASWRGPSGRSLAALIPPPFLSAPRFRQQGGRNGPSCAVCGLARPRPQGYQDPMPGHDLRTPRLYLEAPLTAGATLPPDRGQTNYLVNVLGRTTGNPLTVLNGAGGDGRAGSEWVSGQGAQ